MDFICWYQTKVFLCPRIDNADLSVIRQFYGITNCAPVVWWYKKHVAAQTTPNVFWTSSFELNIKQIVLSERRRSACQLLK